MIKLLIRLACRRGNVSRNFTVSDFAARSVNNGG
jgi:hypothetical protein